MPSHLPPLTSYFMFTQENLYSAMCHLSVSMHPLTNVYPFTHHAPESVYSPAKAKPQICWCQLTTCQ